jgi:hypothetical protein
LLCANSLVCGIALELYWENGEVRWTRAIHAYYACLYPAMPISKKGKCNPFLRSNEIHFRLSGSRAAPPRCRRRFFACSAICARLRVPCSTLCVLSKKKNSVWSSKYSLRLILVDGSNRYFRVSRAVNSKLPRAQTIYVEHLGRVWDGIGVAI